MSIYNPDNFYSWYRVLGLEAGCSWKQVKQAYRQSVQSWHPDRFPEDSQEKSEAEELIVQITHAYRSLLEYHDKHGKLPGHREIRGASDELDDQEQSTVKGEYAENAGMEQPHTSDKRYQYQKSDGKWRRRLIILAAVIYGIYFLLQDPSSDNLSTGTQGPVNKKQIKVKTDPDRPITSGDKKKFTIGSTKGEVIDIHGTPTEVDRSIWYYGKSKIYFKDGKVKSWRSDPETPLNATFDSGVLSKRTAWSMRTSRIRKGSTKADVLAVQGEPLYKMARVWDYGASKIYFKNGLVAGWDSSSLNPLKVAE